MIKESTVGFALCKIATIQFAIIENAFVEEKNIQLKVGINYDLNYLNKIVTCFTRFEFIINENPFLIIHIGCEFKIEDSSWDSFINKEKNTIIFPKNFMCHLAVITTGTVRGILHAKTENTKFNTFFLPTIDISNMIKEDISFNIEVKK